MTTHSGNPPRVEGDLDGRVAVVTGATRGLGRAIATGLARRGASVVVSSRKQDACDVTARELTDAHGVETLAVAAHVGSWSACEELVAAADERFGKVDMLVNNAGIAPAFETLGAVTEELFDKTLQVNLKGPFRLCQLVGERMHAAGGGTILNISSMSSQRPRWNEAPYAAAKAGLNILTTCFAQAWGPSVRVNAILAGPFSTDIAAGWDRAVIAQLSQEWPLRRVGDPVEIVDAALFLLSAQSSFVTGALLAVDGGRLAAQ